MRLLLTLFTFFRIVELKDGSITIDGVNCSEIGLDVLRRRLAVIPQDSVLLYVSLDKVYDDTKH